MRVIKAPQYPSYYPEMRSFNVFLAGSIEMGTAENWQDKLANSLSDLSDELILFNPRRDDWDSSWVQSIDNVQFKEQVVWELKHLEYADLVVFYFDPNTKSPITLMELGLTVGLDDSSIAVCCPHGFWRRGNIEILCERYDIDLVSSLEDLSTIIKSDFEERIDYSLAFVDWKNGV